MTWRDDTYTHSMEIVINGLYPHDTDVEQVRLKIAGDGSLEYFVETFRAALVAFGFVPDTARKLGIVEEVAEE